MKYDCLFNTLGNNLHGLSKIAVILLLILILALSSIWRLLERLERLPVVIGPKGVYVPFWVRWFRRD